ncbi:MAG: M20/M25/M40 family metallo-hydrolase, partial [Raoultibacter sp.]
CCGVEPVVSDGVIRSAGDTVLGADDKAGIAAIFEALETTLAEGRPRPSITVLLTVCEELSLLGSGALEENLFDGTVPCFVFDADGAPGSIILGAPFHYTLKAHFIGRAAHAGVEPERGVSAIQMAAEAIAAMPLGRIDECTTANIGMIKGGREVNIVADSCTIDGECRSLYEDRVNTQRDAMTQALEAARERFDGSIDIDWHLDYPGVLFDAADPIVDKLFTAARNAGLKPRASISGGGADANLLGTKGAQAITLGIGMTNFHTHDEHISVTDLEGTERFIEAIIAEVCE